MRTYMKPAMDCEVFMPDEFIAACQSQSGQSGQSNPGSGYSGQGGQSAPGGDYGGQGGQSTPGNNYGGQGGQGGSGQGNGGQMGQMGFQQQEMIPTQAYFSIETAATVSSNHS